MRSHGFRIVLAAAALSGAAPALAQDLQPPAAPAAPASQEQSDRALLYRLIREVRSIDRKTERLMEQAMAEAREHDGQADPQTKAKLLAARDERDRTYSRLLILSMRYGWEIPEFDKPAVQTSTRAEAEHSVFGAADAMVRQRFAGEALKIAELVRMPVVSLESSSG